MIDVQRPAEAPASLAGGRSYRGRDVLEALHAAFRGKCYLCEVPVAIGALEVDHRKPQGEPRFGHLVHDWTNLFPACVTFRCNQRRQKKYPEGDLLSPGEGVETRVLQEIERTISTCLRTTGKIAFRFRPTELADAPAVNAASELDRLHNSGGSLPADALRTAILEHVGALEPGMRTYEMLCAHAAADPLALAAQKQWVKRFVGRDAPFTMLVRSYFHHLDAVRALFD
jgi:hypothetical protein